MRTVATSKRPFPCTVGSWSGPHKGKGSQLCVLPYLFFSTTLGGGFSQFTEEEPEPQGCTWQVLNLKRGLCCFQHLSLPWHPCHSGDWCWDQDQGVPLTWGGAPSMCADHGNPSSLPPAGLPPPCPCEHWETLAWSWGPGLSACPLGFPSQSLSPQP